MALALIAVQGVGCWDAWGGGASNEEVSGSEASGPLEAADPAPVSEQPASAPGTVQSRIPPTEGFVRVAQAPGSFGHWLRERPLLPGRPDVLLYNGELKRNQTAHHAVIDIDVGSKDLQQCADAVMRLRAEYLYAGSCANTISFNFTSGDAARWSMWQAGQRPKVQGNSVSWHTTSSPDGSHQNFRRYLNTVFMYAGSASLERELVQVADPSKVQPGDVFIQGGYPGHAVVVLDVAENESGERQMMLAQSYMPAQQIHILRGFDARSPWYTARRSGVLQTPEWRFDYSDLHRFDSVDCVGE